MDNNRTPQVLGPQDGEAFWGFGSLWTIKASAEQTGGRFSFIEETAPQGAATPLHVHQEDDETFYVLEGELTFYFDADQPIAASAGSFVHIPGGAAHAFRVDSEGARYLNHHDSSTRTILSSCLWRSSTVANPSARGAARYGKDQRSSARV